MMLRSEIRQRAATAPATFIALGCVGLFAAPALAQDAVQSDAPRLGGVTVTDTAIDESPVLVREVESPKATAPILDTPQTITVISDQTLRKQNLLTLRDALQTVPGITFTAGEGGGGYGDRINLRGYAADNDITQDGVRDSAQYSRTDPFNLQQIEVYNGANSVFNGSGSVGGTINLVSKVPQASDLTIISGGVGTDNYYRATIDTNQRISDLVAVRLNAMYHQNEYPGRDVEEYERWGIAPSVTIGIDGPTRLTASYFHQEDANVPIFGVPYYRTLTNAGPVPGVNDSDYFGIVNLDDQRINVDRLTLTFEHDFSETLQLRNLSRWQRVDQDSITSAPQGAYCLSGGVLPTGAPCATGQVPGFYYPSGPRGLGREQENQLFYNQTDLKFVAGGDGLRSTFNVGLALTQEDYTLRTVQYLRNPGGALPNPAQPPIDFTDPDTTYAGPINPILASAAKGSTDNIAAYVFNTTEIGDHFEINGAVRWERNEGVFRSDTFATPDAGGAVTRGLNQVSEDEFVSYRVGALYKPVDWASLYISYGNSRIPTSATVRLGCGALITAPAGVLDPCDVEPETAVNWEIGGKAEVLDGRLLLTAAVFRNERTNYRVATNDPIVTTLPVADGRSRVDGIALGASGNISENWLVFANYTYLDSKVLQSVSDFCLANPGPLPTTPVTNPCGNSAVIPDPQRGNELTQTPQHSGSLFTSYTLPFGLELGYGFTYQGSFTLNNNALVTPLAPTAALTPVFKSDDYLIHRAFVSYAFDNGLTAQLNVQNFTDEDYYASIRNNGWATPGEGRSAVLILFYSF